MIRIIIKDIPSRSLFYNDSSEDLYSVTLLLENGCVKDPVTCFSQQLVDNEEVVEKYYEELLPYIKDNDIKRLLILSIIEDTRQTINHYAKKISDSTPEELNSRLGNPDQLKWWTMAYPTRLEVYQEHIYNEKQSLKRYEDMLKLQ
ncbi:hypothetical protein MO973_24525 [Paenibacillus sp. TRM 82003]|nr:hypothetical protein [Paenibacillus sp. TRM 82003]MCI3923397.1 hypothetical protein [Paenibacillus sp. TRM 82003]